MATPETTEHTPAAPEKAPWYSLNPKHLRFSKFTWYFLVAAVLIGLPRMVSIKPLWVYGWEHRIYGFENFYPQKAASGWSHRGGDWTQGGTILVYGMPEVDQHKIRSSAQGLQGLIDELGLALTVRVVTTEEAGAVNSLRKATEDIGGSAYFNFDRFMEQRLDERKMRFGEMIVVNIPFTDPSWAHGLSVFPTGIAALQETYAGDDLGRHEGAHLIGYNHHDDLPWYILGYAEDSIPLRRNTLMMLMPTDSQALSPRARDALLAFWRGMEKLHRTHYFTAAATTAK
ncbi:MAG: hypothetical protein ACYC7E_02150 [Armatimonadota bacterium]